MKLLDGTRLPTLNGRYMLELYAHSRAASGSGLMCDEITPVRPTHIYHYNFYLSDSTDPTHEDNFCGTADFNCDGDVGTDNDIIDFFACIGGNCPPCAVNADFNGDGDVGTDQDIEAFFRVLGGGHC